MWEIVDREGSVSTLLGFCPVTEFGDTGNGKIAISGDIDIESFRNSELESEPESKSIFRNISNTGAGDFEFNLRIAFGGEWNFTGSINCTYILGFGFDGFFVKVLYFFICDFPA